MFNSVTDPRVKLFGLTYTSNLSPTKLLEVKAGYSSFSQIIDINNKIDPRSLGIDTGPLDPRDFGVPYVDYFSSFGYIGGVGGYPITTAPNASTDLAASMTWIKDNHTFKVGGSFSHATTFSLRNRARTTLEFSGGTADPVDSITAMLLGRADLASRSFGDTTRHLVQNSFGLYLSDDWRVSPRFTVNLGLRYDLNKPLTERDNLAANFFPDRGLVTLGQGIDQLYSTDKNNLGPRLGFSWDVGGDGKTVVRGGYSLTYDVATFAAIHAPYAIAGARSGAFSQPNQGIFGVGLSGDLSVLPDDPAATCIDPNVGVGDYVCIQPNVPLFGNSPRGVPPFNAFSVKEDLKTPYFHLFHLTFQRLLGKRVAVTASYVGQRGRDLLSVHDLNAPPVGTPLDAIQENRPFNSRFPDLKHIVQVNNDAKSWYNSVQLSLRQQNWKGFNTQYNLTLSRCRDYNSVNRGGLGQAGQFSNPYNIAANLGPCESDVPINFNVGGTYSIPSFGKGFGEGWEVAALFVANSGRPYTAHVNRDRSGQDFDRVRANCAPGEISYNQRDANNYIANPEIFSDVADGQVGTCGRNTIRGPNFRQLDFSLMKTTKLSETVKLQLRLEAFNLLNRANFGFLTTNVRSGSFGTVSSTPDSDQLNPVLTSGGARAFQLVGKIIF